MFKLLKLMKLMNGNATNKRFYLEFPPRLHFLPYALNNNEDNMLSQGGEENGEMSKETTRITFARMSKRVRIEFRIW